MFPGCLRPAGHSVLRLPRQEARENNLHLQQPQTEEFTPTTLLRDIMREPQLLTVFGEFYLHEISWADDRTPRNIAGDQFLALAHTHRLLQHLIRWPDLEVSSNHPVYT